MADLKKLSMLVVEDDELIRKMVISWFRDGPYEFIEAEDGADGLRKAMRYKPDVIITDKVPQDKKK